MERHEALTMSYAGPANRIIIPVAITDSGGVTRNYPGLIDTGATHTCLSAELVAEMGFQPISFTEVDTAGGRIKDVPVYVVELISLCSGRMLFPKHKVTQTHLKEQQGVELLIGMDILLQGDFALTNKGGKTMASFRIPSVHEYNFIGEVENWNRFEAERERREANKTIGSTPKKKRHNKGHKRRF